MTIHSFILQFILQFILPTRSTTFCFQSTGFRCLHQRPLQCWMKGHFAFIFLVFPFNGMLELLDTWNNYHSTPTYYTAINHVNNSTSYPILKAYYELCIMYCLKKAANQKHSWDTQQSQHWLRLKRFTMHLVSKFQICKRLNDYTNVVIVFWSFQTCASLNNILDLLINETDQNLTTVVACESGKMTN